MEFKTGQLIKASVNNAPLIYHYGIVIYDSQNNVRILHNTPFKDSVNDSLDDWLSSRQLISISNTSLTNKSNDYVVSRFDRYCKGEYSLFRYNCEHFVDCMTGKNHNSEQGMAWLFIITLIVIYFVISSL